MLLYCLFGDHFWYYYQRLIAVFHPLLVYFALQNHYNCRVFYSIFYRVRKKFCMDVVGANIGLKFMKSPKHAKSKSCPVDRSLFDWLSVHFRWFNEKSRFATLMCTVSSELFSTVGKMPKRLNNLSKISKKKKNAGTNIGIISCIFRSILKTRENNFRSLRNSRKKKPLQ